MGSNDDLKTLTSLLDLTNEGWELASEIEKPDRLKQLVSELRSKARADRFCRELDHPHDNGLGAR